MPRIRSGSDVYSMTEVSSHDLFKETVSCEVIYNTKNPPADNLTLQWYDEKMMSLEVTVFENKSISTNIMNLTSTFRITSRFLFNKRNKQPFYDCCLMSGDKKLNCTRTNLRNDSSFLSFNFLITIISFIALKLV